MNINKHKSYQALIIVNEMIAFERKFPVILDDEDKILEPIFANLFSKEYIAIENYFYIVTPSGISVYETFMKRYQEFLKVYDIYSCVDVDRGQFAFEKYFDFNSDEDWDKFKNEQRFFDIRIAVAKYKKIDAEEIVFMSFLNENRIDSQVPGWQNLIVGDTIDDICRGAITFDDLGGEHTMNNIVTEGSKLLKWLIEEELRLKKEELENATDSEIITETTTVIETYEDDYLYYEPYYYDPFYYSPIWIAPLFIW